MDSQGNYWTALFEGGRLLQFSPGGRLLRELLADVKRKISLWLAERGAVDIEGCIFAIGKDADLQLMVDIAKWGRGRLARAWNRVSCARWITSLKCSMVWPVCSEICLSPAAR